MSAPFWSKFYWADWLKDTQLRRCSPAARALWIDMLCVAAENEPIGYLANGDDALDEAEIARMTGFTRPRAVRLMAELERCRVFSRDDKGCIFSRRMVRDAQAFLRAKRDGLKGGNLNLINGASLAGVNPPLNPPVIPLKQEARIQKPEASGGPGASRFPLERAAAALRVPLERLVKKPAWLVFGDMAAGWAAEGCDAERDVWPAIARLASRLKQPPASPAYFRQAILEARDRRLAQGAPHAASDVEWADRLAVFAAEGAWSSRWGPKPGEAGCAAPQRKTEHGTQGSE